jgi:hypothetical protein
MPAVARRAEPLCCARCESRTLRPHCPDRRCRWVVCLKCDAVTGFVSVWEAGKMTRFVRRYAGGKDRTDQQGAASG